MKIAVIGGGIAGIAVSHLLSGRAEVTLYESNNYLGGHTYTHQLSEDLGIDTGFIVFNRKTYPNFCRFLYQLGVESQESDMSFGYHCQRSGLQYGGHDLATLFAQPTNLFHPTFLRLVIDMLRFNQVARHSLQRGTVTGSLGDFVAQVGLSRYFLHHYLTPLGASLWSAPADKMAEFPADTYLRFFANHGLLDLQDRPLWRTVKGGSSRYVEAFLRKFRGTVELSAKAEKVGFDRERPWVRVGGSRQTFDHVVLATHADQALALLEQPDPLQRELLAPWNYSTNSITLHTDSSVMPPLRKIWSSWNYVRRQGSESRVTMTYYMNRLQNLDTPKHYFVTLNDDSIRPGFVLTRRVYSHPQFDQGSAAVHARLPELNGHPNLSFCGSYFGYGFHEDAFASAVSVDKKLARQLG